MSASPDLATAAVIDERRDTVEYVRELLDDLYRHGSCDVRIVFSEVPGDVYEDVEGQTVRRFPEGEVKVERPAVGLSIEYVREPA